jgi:hypothetical protein
MSWKSVYITSKEGPDGYVSANEGMLNFLDSLTPSQASAAKVIRVDTLVHGFMIIFPISPEEK